MPTRRSSLTPRYGYSDRARRYINLDTGRFVSWRRGVRPALDQVVSRSQARLKSLSRDLVGGGVSLAEWQTAMMREIKTIHTLSATIARGGWAQMTPADWGRVGQLVRGEYGYLRTFAAQIASGEQPLTGEVVRRAASYANAGVKTMEIERKQVMVEAGALWAKNILGVADHCAGCLAETRRGWVPVGLLVPVGQRDCLSNDKCTIVYSFERERPTL